MGAVKRAAIIGTGTMGPGMGAVLARAGSRRRSTTSAPTRSSARSGGVALAEGALDRLEAVQVDGGGITFESDLAPALDGAELVIEAAPERLDLKQELFAEFEKHVAPTRSSRRTRRASRSRRSRPTWRAPSASSACTGRTRRT